MAQSRWHWMHVCMYKSHIYDAVQSAPVSSARQYSKGSVHQFLVVILPHEELWLFGPIVDDINGLTLSVDGLPAKIQSRESTGSSQLPQSLALRFRLLIMLIAVK